MLTKEDMQQLVDYALEHRQDVGAISFPFELAKHLQATVPDWKDSAIEEIRQRIQDIMQDIILRHQPFHSQNPDITKVILEEVNFQLNTRCIHLHTLIPIRGLSVRLNFRETIEIDEEITLRRIQRWEWPKFDMLIQEVGFDLPEFALEMVKEISPNMIDNDFQDGINELEARTRLILGILQFRFGQGMSFPWIIRFVPQCQFVKGHGKMMARLFPMAPGDYIAGTHDISEVGNIRELLRNRNTLDAVTRYKIDIAINRFHEGANRQNIVDCQVDYWIALESLFGTGESGQSRQMACRISCLLFGDQENDDVVKAFLWLEKSYQLRCNIVHGDHHSKDGANFNFLYKIVVQTKEVVKWTVERLLLLQVSYQEVLEQINKRSHRVNLPSKVKRILSDETTLGSILTEMDQVMDRYRGRIEHTGETVFNDDYDYSLGEQT
ncbi:HEPN domain-containing protein [Paenibacillus sp. GP183]|uniref:HEPN domain-containing protein n=1 Tax=Paenibacillus sp. GP183 TaxID=1882751 RepID=UPI000898FE24|nr:HEPN domain-containing protein [Paenibacillus sp. GP183]SED15094.1 hypothetical protein SAMN05443246_5918 [Paenibacillus sp. GP183]